MSSLGGRLLAVIAYETKMGQNVSLLEYGNFRDSTHAPMSMQCFIHVKVNFEKTKSHLEISVSCAS